MRTLNEELYYKDTNLIKKEVRIKRMNDKDKSNRNTPTPGNEGRSRMEKSLD